MDSGFITKVSAAAFLVSLLAACGGGPQRAPAIGEGFVGPAELRIRSDIPLGSSTVAVVRQGERLEIIQQRRRLFLRVRTPKGAEGWTDARQLLSAKEMGGIEALAERARKLPSQGGATTWDDLRIHTQPSRGAPSFLLLKEGDKVDVLAHVVVPRGEVERDPLIPPAPKKEPAARKPAKPPKYAPPPMPKPPGPPANWIEMSQTAPVAESVESAVDETSEAEPSRIPVDDWSLIRARDGQAGWVLTSRLYMAIPDEVAQYAEGHRIVSYFALGEVQDGDQTRRNWLWTTMASGPQAYDFDSFRVFVWSLRRHRYETAYIERNVKGRLPVLLRQVAYGKGAPGASGAAYPGFSLCVQKADGSWYRREYAFLTNIVRFAGEQPCEAPQGLDSGPSSPAENAAKPAAPERSESFMRRIGKRLSGLAGRWFGKR